MDDEEVIAELVDDNDSDDENVKDDLDNLGKDDGNLPNGVTTIMNEDVTNIKEAGEETQKNDYVVKPTSARHGTPRHAPDPADIYMIN